MKLFRWRAIVPLSLLLLLIGVVWWLLLDSVVERTVEDIGAELVGARVDLAAADVDLGDGRVRLLGLEVANPDAPMRNLFEAEEIVADVGVISLLRKKVIIDQVSLRGMRFGTERETSGALENPSPTAGRLTRTLNEWTGRVRAPQLSLEGLSAVVNVEAVRAESLQTIRQARLTTALADSARQDWEQRVRQLNPVPLIDSARTLIDALNRANPLTLGVTGMTRLASSARTTVGALQDERARFAQLDSVVRGGMRSLGASLEAVAAAREDDYRYARGLLRLPSLEGPDLSASVFGDMALDRVRPLLYWANRAARYLPPGLDPRRRAGPTRARRPGTTITFPEGQGRPKFLLAQADADLLIGGMGAAAGAYAGRLVGLTTEPAVYGRPLEIAVERTGAVRGPTDVRVTALLDRTGAAIRDTANVLLRGLSLPSVRLGVIGAELDLRAGTSELAFSRDGDRVAGRWRWSSGAPQWTRLAGADSAAGSGLVRRAREVLWQALAAMDTVTVEARFVGSPTGPELSVTSNVGRVAAGALRQALGQEVQRAEQQLRARVDALIAGQVDQANAKVDSVRTEVAAQVERRLQELEQVRSNLEQTLRRRIPVPQSDP